MKKFVSALVPVVLLFSCIAVPSKPRLPLADAGSVSVYVQPFPQEADALTFSLDRIAAIRDDGQEFELSLRLHEIRGTDMTRQRLLCEGTLPAGSYVALSFLVRKASLKVEDGDARLLTPDNPVPLNLRFQAAQRTGLVLFVSFNYQQSISGSFSFNPSFSVFSPSKPLTAVLGYVSNAGSSSLTIIDKNTRQAVGSIAGTGPPKGLALNHWQKRVYVATTDDAVEAIDCTSGNLLNKIRINPGDGPQGIALSPDGRTLLVANSGSNTVSVIDTTLLIETARISVGTRPGAVLMDRAGKRAYVFNAGSDSLSVIDVQKRAVVTTVPTEPEPLWGQFNAKGDRLYIIHGHSAYMAVLDPVRFTVLSRVYVGMGMNALKVDSATDLIYAGRKGDKGVEVYDPVSLVPFDFIETGQGPSYMTIDGEGNNLWIIGGRTPALIVVDLTSKKVVSEIDVGEEPSWLSLTGER